MDHRELNNELDFYTFDPDMVGVGLPLWLPNGAVVIEELERLAKDVELMAGYSRVKTPHIGKENLYLTSGHLPYYKDSMFPPIDVDGEKYYLKAMNCPHHHRIFGSKPRSYRDLPMRLAEFGSCYRYEAAGSLMGLMRVRNFTINDSHIYCDGEQLDKEIEALVKMHQFYFDYFGIKNVEYRLSKHDPAKLGQKYFNNGPIWLIAEDMIRRQLKNSNIQFIEKEDEAAFYGPKIDIEIKAENGREFTLATIQLDFCTPRRFQLTYTTKEDKETEPICIHRSPLGTHERFIGFLMEHYQGKFPFWLSPEQVRVIPISEKHIEYAKDVETEIRQSLIRVTGDYSQEPLGKRISNARAARVFIIAVVGDDELAKNTVSVRSRGDTTGTALRRDLFAAKLRVAKEQRLATI